MPEVINDDDILARSLLEPKDQIEILDSALQLIRITSSNFTFNSSNDNKESVNCLRLFKGDKVDSCHKSGLLKMQINNKRITQDAEKKGKEPVLREYIGYASTTHLNVRSISNNDVQFSVTHKEENGNCAHCDIQFSYGDNVQEKTNKQKKKIKNAAISILSDRFSDYTKLS